MYGFHAPELFFLIIGILVTFFWIWMLIDCATKEPSKDNDKVIWILVILLAPFIGALIYSFVRRPVRIRLLGR